MAVAGGVMLSVWTLASALCLVSASAGGIAHLFKIGLGHTRPPSMEGGDMADDAIFFNKLHFDKNWTGSSSSSFFVLPDHALTVCILLVLSYMLYIIIALLVKPTLIPSELEKNPGLRSLIGDHRFKDNIVPGAIRDFYQDTGVGVHYTPLMKTSLTSPGVQAVEKTPIPAEDCVSADCPGSALSEEGDVFHREQSGTIHL